MLNTTEYKKVIQDTFGWELDEPATFESFSFEIIEKPIELQKWIENNWAFAYYAGAAYIIAIFGLKEYMKSRPAYQLRTTLFFWNAILGVFSIFGFIRTAPELMHVLSQEDGFFNSLCVKKGLNGPFMFWATAFAISKFVELGDTIFIVLRKRPLVFLQWFHHVVTLWVTWTVSPLVEPILRWYGVLNYGVHSLMYPYFALKTIGITLPTVVSNVITTLQLSQMLIAFAVNIASLFLLHQGYDCARYPVSIRAFLFVYGSFVILFGHLFYKSVIVAKRKMQPSSIRATKKGRLKTSQQFAGAICKIRKGIFTH